MSLKKEFQEFINTKPVPPYATLPKSGIDVEWNELMKGWKVDMGMSVDEFLERNPDILENIKTKHPNLIQWLKEGKISVRTIMKRGLAEAILSEMIDATDLPAGEADRIFKGQQLRFLGTGTLDAAARDEVYQNAFKQGQLPGRTSLNLHGGVRQRSPVITALEQGSFLKGEIPEAVGNKEFYRYAKAQFEKTGKRVENNAFKYKGKSYGFEKAGRNSRLAIDGVGYKIYRSGDKQAAEAYRNAMLKGLTPEMTVDEWLEIRDIYRYAADHGLEVDHIRPIEKYGLHHPSNLQLLTIEDNRAKGINWTEGGTNWSKQAKEWTKPLEHTASDVKWANRKVAGELKKWGTGAEAIAKKAALGTGVLAALTQFGVRTASALPLEAATFGAWKGFDALVWKWSQEDLDAAQTRYNQDPSQANLDDLNFAKRQLAFDTGSVFDPTFVSDTAGIANIFTNPAIHRWLGKDTIPERGSTTYLEQFNDQFDRSPEIPSETTF